MTELLPDAEQASVPVLPVQTGSALAHADVIQSVTRLDRAIKDRRETDETLVNWWLYFLLLSWITLGGYTIYLFFKRISRIDGFSDRKHAYYDALLEWTQRQAEIKDQEDEVHHQLADLRTEVSKAYQADLRPIKAGLSFVLTIVTLGIYGLVVHYRLNRYWWDAQAMEQDFDDKLSQMWIKLGLVRYPLTYRTDQTKRRSFPLYLILSVVTLGVWALVWDYKFQTDPDNLFGEFHSIEDSVLQTARSH